MEEYKKMFKNYAVFTGRSTSRDFWVALLFNIIVSFVIGFVGGLLKLNFLGAIYALAVFIPGLALEIRRLHDINKSGWYIFISLIPIVGWIILLVMLCQPSVDEGNEYGDIVE